MQRTWGSRIKRTAAALGGAAALLAAVQLAGLGTDAVGSAPSGSVAHAPAEPAPTATPTVKPENEDWN